MFEAASLTASSIQKAPFTSEAKDSAFNLRFGTSPYTWYAENPERGARFASAMAGYVQSMYYRTISWPDSDISTVNRDHAELRDRFPWARLGKNKVVDVGGGSGHVSIFLASVSTRSSL